MDNWSFKNLIRLLVYGLAKSLGLFRLALKLTENDYRILCYHGGSIDDEHIFWPNVFISEDVFKKHLNLIQKYHFKVLPLDEVIKNASQYKVLKKGLVLTFDDGFYNTKTIEPLLKKENYRATLYVTTYYVTHQRPIFNIALPYILFKTKAQSFDISFNGEHHAFNIKKNGFDLKIINEYAKTLNESEQNQLLKKISIQLNFDLDVLIQQRLFNNLNADELKTIHKNGNFDIQLHTHRHALPNDMDGIIYEVKKNRKLLSEMTGKKEESLVHFCYPSGLWNNNHLLPLKNLNISSATTLDPGLNNYKTDPLQLKRILCTNNQPLLFFEAELTGFKTLIKNKLNVFKYMKHKYMTLLHD